MLQVSEHLRCVRWLWAVSNMDTFCLTIFGMLGLCCVFIHFDFLVSIWFSDEKTMSWSLVIIVKLDSVFYGPPRCPSGEGVRRESGRCGVRFPLAPWGFSRVESYQWLENWHRSGYPARHLALWGQCWDWFARCQYTVTGWRRKFDL